MGNSIPSVLASEVCMAQVSLDFGVSFRRDAERGADTSTATGELPYSQEEKEPREPPSACDPQGPLVAGRSCISAIVRSQPGRRRSAPMLRAADVQSTVPRQKNTVLELYRESRDELGVRD